MYHVPVLIKEVLEFLNPGPERVYVDCTIGEGGHAEKILKYLAPDGLLIGIDKDERSLQRASDRLKRYKGIIHFYNRDYREIEDILEEQSIEDVDGILADLGVSSFQLNEGDRGFSFNRNGPLDMRYDPSKGASVLEYIHNTSRSGLEESLRELGEERMAKKLSHIIHRYRKEGRMKTTFDLKKAVLEVKGRRGGIHPATKTFQALRMVVNDELGALRVLIETIPQILRPSGHACIISYHSLEDRLVKRYFSAFSSECNNWRTSGEKKPLIKIVTKKPVSPSEEEMSSNPRSRSAKLRVIERLKYAKEPYKEDCNTHHHPGPPV